MGKEKRERGNRIGKGGIKEKLKKEKKVKNPKRKEFKGKKLTPINNQL
jgi:hypothetical protein